MRAASYCVLRWLTLCCVLVFPAHAVDSKPPNIVLLLADDLGFSDTSPYGSEVNTPSIADLAAQGVRFTNYHTAANCAPSRAMLMTGVSNHLAGVPNIPEMLSPQQKLQENYQGVLGDNVVTIATLLEGAGYHTYMAGKWHLGATKEKLPSRRGFQRTVALMDSGADNWEQRPYLPIYETANWYADGERYDLPDDFYSSEFLIDKTIEFIDANRTSEQPFFAYVPFQAVHLPVQAPQEFIDRYMGVYDEGWAELRQARLERAIELGIVPESTQLRTMSTTDDWDALSAERKRYESKRMAVYAGMIEAMDSNIGRLIEYLKQNGLYDNTIFIFTSDNGAEGSGAPDPTVFPANRLTNGLGYTTDYETLGLKGSYSSISPSFTSAAVSPLAYYKFYTGEGGMRVPLVISGKPIENEMSQLNAFTWATDIAVTILSYAGVDQPGERFGGKPVLPMTGRDLKPLIAGKVARVYGPQDEVGYELTGHSVLFRGDYKLVRNRPPLGDGQWYLYNIIDDPGEFTDLKEQHPQKFQSMLQAYAKFETENQVQALPAGYSQTGQIAQNYMKEVFRPIFIVGVLTLLILIPFVVFARVKRAG